MSERKQLWSQGAVVRRDLSRYWSAYGGWRSLLTSPYFIASVVLTALLAPLWLKPGWWDDVISAEPDLLGFSLGGLAVLLAFGDDRFRGLLAKAGGEKPRLLALSASFVHFIVVQCVAWILALLSKAWYVPVPDWLQEAHRACGISDYNFVSFTRCGWALAFLTFIYSILALAAATFRIFNTTNTFVTVTRSDSESREPAEAKD